MANILHVERTDNKITLGTTGTTINIASHTVSKILALDASKNLEVVTIGTGLDYTRPTLSLADPLVVPGKLTAGSFGSPLDVTNTRQHGFELHYSGNNYDVIGIRSRAQLVTTDTSATAQGALLQAANNDNVNVGCLNGCLIEAIGKATTNAATIAMMRGCLVNTEWSAKDTITDLRVLHVRTHTRDAATEGYVSGTGYGIYIENEAVGGNGQALDAGIYFKGTNLSAGNKAFDYGLDFSGATYDTTEIKLKDGGTLGSSGASVNIDSSGNVGIGIDNPTDPLHVVRAGGASIVFEFTDNDAGAEFEFKHGLIYGGGINFFGPTAGSTIRNGFGVQSGIDDDGFIFFRTKTSGTYEDRIRILNDGKVGINTTSPVTKLTVEGIVTLPKASGNGIKIDTTTPTFGWADLQAEPSGINTGATKPTQATYRDTLKQFQFATGDEEYYEYHIPHDYVPGTDIFLHVHWSHTSGAVTGGTIVFTVESSYAKGHNRAAFPASVSGDFNGTASSTQYRHIVSETQLSASAPGGLQIDTDDLEPDGIIIMRVLFKTNSMTGATPDIFIHHVDVHYQTTGLIGTKQKAPDFYT